MVWGARRCVEAAEEARRVAPAVAKIATSASRPAALRANYGIHALVALGLLSGVVLGARAMQPRAKPSAPAAVRVVSPAPAVATVTPAPRRVELVAVHAIPSALPAPPAGPPLTPPARVAPPFAVPSPPVELSAPTHCPRPPPALRRSLTPPPPTLSRRRPFPFYTPRIAKRADAQQLWGVLWLTTEDLILAKFVESPSMSICSILPRISRMSQLPESKIVFPAQASERRHTRDYVVIAHS